MLPFVNRPRFILKMARVAPNQKSTFESDELFRRLNRENKICYTGYSERLRKDRQICFEDDCRKGHTEISFVGSGVNLQLVIHSKPNQYHQDNVCDFEKEIGKVHIKSCLIMNGVSVRFCGWLDLDRLDGVGWLEYDEQRAKYEDNILSYEIAGIENRRMS